MANQLEDAPSREKQKKSCRHQRHLSLAGKTRNVQTLHAMRRLREAVWTKIKIDPIDIDSIDDGWKNIWLCICIHLQHQREHRLNSGLAPRGSKGRTHFANNSGSSNHFGGAQISRVKIVRRERRVVEEPVEAPAAREGDEEVGNHAAPPPPLITNQV